MIAEIVAIGTELLMGQIVNTDAQYLSQRLQSLGISVYYHTTVGDNPQRMRDTLALALSRSDIVFTTGGLGPTQDDSWDLSCLDMLSWDFGSIQPVRIYLPALQSDCF